MSLSISAVEGVRPARTAVSDDVACEVRTSFEELVPTRTYRSGARAFAIAGSRGATSERLCADTEE